MDENERRPGHPGVSTSGPEECSSLRASTSPPTSTSSGSAADSLMQGFVTALPTSTSSRFAADSLMQGFVTALPTSTSSRFAAESLMQGFVTAPPTSTGQGLARLQSRQRLGLGTSASYSNLQSVQEGVVADLEETSSIGRRPRPSFPRRRTFSFSEEVKEQVHGGKPPSNIQQQLHHVRISLGSTCDSSCCTQCHRHSIDAISSDQNRKRSLGDHRLSSGDRSSFGDLRVSFGDRRFSTGGRRSFSESNLSHGGGMVTSSSDSDHTFYGASEAPCMDGDDDMEEDDDDFKRARKFSSDWMRCNDRHGAPNTWGEELEGTHAETSHPVPARFCEVCTLLPSDGSMAGSTKHIVSDLQVSRNGLLLAGATRAKQICIYSVDAALQDQSNASYTPAKAHCMPARMSALSWSPASDCLLAIGDHDGVLWQKDMETGHVTNEIDECNGDRVWSISHSPFHPTVVACSSGKGTVNLRDTGDDGRLICSISMERSMPVCSVEFSSQSEYLLAMASADHNVYLYDLRNTAQPLFTLEHHSRPVAYVRFMSGTRMASSSIDGSVALWDGLDDPNGPRVVKAFRDHKNSKNFAGLSVDASNLVACGSEDGAAYAYFPCWEQRVACTMPPKAAGSDCFVTSVAWLRTENLNLPIQDCPPILAVADTRGCLKMHALIRTGAPPAGQGHGLMGGGA